MSEKPTLNDFEGFEDQLDAYAQEAGIAELQELYERIEGIYVRAAVAVAVAGSVQVDHCDDQPCRLGARYSTNLTIQFRTGTVRPILTASDGST